MLVSPVFHGYWRAINGALAARGHEVTSWRYDERPGTLAKARHKIIHEARDRRGGEEGSRRASAEMTETAVAVLKAARPDVVVIVRGDGLGDDFWQAVADLGAASIVWLYDEMRRTTWTPERLATIGPIATYSPLDARDLAAAGVDADYLPLAYDSRATWTARESDEVSFVGARYPNREVLLRGLVDKGVPVRAYGRDWSGHLVDRLRTWRLGSPTIPAGRDLDREHAYGVMAGSPATLNIHGDQDGFTMRTFEAAGVGGVQLVDRPDVVSLYEPGREVLTFETADEAADLIARIRADRPYAESIRRAAQARTAAEHTFDHRVAALERRWA